MMLKVGSRYIKVAKMSKKDKQEAAAIGTVSTGAGAIVGGVTGRAITIKRVKKRAMQAGNSLVDRSMRKPTNRDPVRSIHSLTRAVGRVNKVVNKAITKGGKVGAGVGAGVGAAGSVIAVKQHLKNKNKNKN